MINLTIPIAGGREQKKPISQIEIDYTTNWQTKHWRTILSAYNNSPFFDYYSEEVKEMIFNPEKRLFNFNLFILEKICKLLNINCLYDITSTLNNQEGNNFTFDISPKNFQENISFGFLNTPGFRG